MKFKTALDVGRCTKANVPAHICRCTKVKSMQAHIHAYSSILTHTHTQYRKRNTLSHTYSIYRMRIHKRQVYLYTTTDVQTLKCTRIYWQAAAHKHSRTHTRTQQPGVWIKTHPIPLAWSVRSRWLPLIGYHNIGSGEEQLLPLDTRRRRPFNRNYIHHISRLADKLTPAWNGANTEPRRVTRQVL